MRDDRARPGRRPTRSSSPGPAHDAPTPDAAPRAYLLVQTDGAPPVQFDLGGALISIGRASDNDVIVDDPVVSRHHCQLKLQHGAYSFADLGSRNGSLVNGQPVDEMALGPGDMIRIGSTEIEFQVARMTGEILRILLLILQLAFLGLLYLILLGFSRSLLRDLRSAELAQMASQAGIGTAGGARVARRRASPSARAIALGPINSIGRNVNSTIFIDDDFVSANHAMLTFRGRSWFIEDQGSTNGTYVNGHRIDRPVALSFGDELTIGRVRMRLER